MLLFLTDRSIQLIGFFFQFNMLYSHKISQFLLINIWQMLAYVRTPIGATCNDVLQLKATFIDVKKRWA